MTPRPRAKAPRHSPPSRWRGLLLYTFGHSTRSLAETVALLRAFGVRMVVDIRTIPRSRHNPQFNPEALAPALAAHGIRYAHLATLGGLRRARRDSPNAAWRNASFRGYADYMQTADFARGLTKLRALTARGPLALMCAEAVPWRCHRSLVADTLVARGAAVEHVVSPTRATPHRMTSFARASRGRVTYPAAAAHSTARVIASRAP